MVFLELNRKNMRQLMLLIVFALLLSWGINNPSQVGGILSGLIGLISPFLLGCCFAFVINILLRPMEALWNRLWGKRKSPLSKKLRRPVCLAFSVILLLGLLSTVFLVLIPQLKETFASIYEMIPQSVEKLDKWWHELSVFLAQFSTILPEPDINTEELIKKLTNLFTKAGGAIANKTLLITSSIFRVFFNLILALIFSFYILGQKESLGRGCRQLIHALINPARADRFLGVMTIVNRSFTNYVTGQVTEAFILGFLCWLGMLILGFPYATVISVVVGFSALIPIFGAWVGAIIGAFLIVFVAPIKALWFIIFLVILQQLEGNLIYPRVVGKSVGLPGIWVLAAVTVGGGAFGILGMLLGVPVFAVVYTLTKEFVHLRTREPGKS